jgi:hypothetical protein
MKRTEFKSIRTLGSNEPLPEGAPRRYRNGGGYIRLRWKVGTNRYVEEYEHRIIAGRPPQWMHVHHVNGDKSDNRPENLLVMTPTDHQHLHDQIKRTQDLRYGNRRALRAEAWKSERQDRREEQLREIKELYASGLSTIEVGERVGLDNSTVFRKLSAAGVAMRSTTDYAAKVDEVEMASRYEAGRSIPSLAAEYRITGGRVREILSEQGVQIRRPGRPKNHPKMAENSARLAVRRRSGGICEVCRSAKATNYQHRKNRSQSGGWEVSNGLDVCGMGNLSGCHGRIHQNPEEAYANGWSVRSTDDPRKIPVVDLSGMARLLDDEGSFEAVDHAA